MSTTALPSASSWRLLTSLARSLRGQYARRGRHRLAWGGALVLTLIETFEWLSSSGSLRGLTGTLTFVAWCAALSVSATFTPRDKKAAAGSLTTLLVLRGVSRERTRWLVPWARAALSWTTHGVASLLLGFAVLGTRSSLQEALGAVVVVLGLGIGSLAYAAVLALVASIAEVLAPERPQRMFWGILIVPALLHSAVPELPSPVNLSTDLTRTVLLAGRIQGASP